MSSEVPTDEPPIFPVRNVRRNGRLLCVTGAQSVPVTRRALLAGSVIAPLALSACRVGDVEVPELPAVEEAQAKNDPRIAFEESVAADTAQLGANAATGTGQLFVGGPNTYNAGTLPSGPSYYGSYVGAAIDAQSLVGATLTFDCEQTVSGSFAQVYMEASWGGTPVS